MNNNNVLYTIENTTNLPLPSTTQLANDSIEIKQAASLNAFSCIYSPLSSGCLLLSLDITLPAEEKATLIEAIKKHTRQTNAIPCLICLSGNDIDFAINLLKAGAFDVLISPTEKTLAEGLNNAFAHDKKIWATRCEQQRLNTAFCQLSEKEQRIMIDITEGDTQRAIANAHGIETIVVERYRFKIMHKLQASSLAELIKIRQILEHSE